MTRSLNSTTAKEGGEVDEHFTQYGLRCIVANGIRQPPVEN